MTLIIIQVLSVLVAITVLIKILRNTYRAGWTSGYIKGVLHAKNNRIVDALTAYEKRWEE